MNSAENNMKDVNEENDLYLYLYPQNNEKEENPKNLSSVQRQTSQQEKKRTNYTDINKDSNLINNTMSQPNTSCKEESSNNLSNAEANIINKNEKTIFKCVSVTDKNKTEKNNVDKKVKQPEFATSQSEKNSYVIKSIIDLEPQGDLVNKNNNQSEDDKLNLIVKEEKGKNFDEDTTKPQTYKK